MENESDGCVTKLRKPRDRQVLVSSLENYLLCHSHRGQYPRLSILIAVGSLAEVDFVCERIADISPRHIEDAVRGDELSLGEC